MTTLKYNVKPSNLKTVSNFGTLIFWIGAKSSPYIYPDRNDGGNGEDERIRKTRTYR